MIAIDDNYTDLNDEQIAAFSLKNPEVYAVLVNRYKDQLLNFVYANFVHDRDQAEDIIQEAFLKAYLHLDTFDITRKWKTWLYKIAINQAYTFLRKPQNEDIEDYVDTLILDGSPEKYVDQQLQKEKVEQAMEQLEPNYRIILDLFYKKDLSYEEISNVLDLHLNTVKTRLHRAKQQLMLNLGQL